jgi:hypothetical protein
MAKGGPQKDQDLRDAGVAVSALKFQTESEARTATDWNTKPAGGTTPYALKGHFV